MNDSTSLKRCSKCKQEFPATFEYFTRDLSKPNGLYSSCKKCKCAESRAHSKLPEVRVRNAIRQLEYKRSKGVKPQKIRAIVNNQTECSRCHLWKDISLFPLASHEVIGLACWCLECHRKYKTQRDRSKGIQPARVGFVNNGKRECIACKKCFPNTKEFFYTNNRTGGFISRCKDCWKEKQINYIKKNPAVAAVAREKRRARNKRLPDSFSLHSWCNCLNYWHGCCAYCGHQQGFEKRTRMSIDHVIPLSNPNSPGNVSSNIVPACRSCNSSKSAKNLTQWLVGKYGKRKAKTILTKIESYFNSVKDQE